MASTFNCPNCSAPLDYEGDEPTHRCPYCNSSVIVPDSLRTPRSGPINAPQLGGGTPWLGSALISPVERLREVGLQIRAGNKVEAIRIYRETFNVGLNEARDAVDALAAGRPVLMPGSPAVGAPDVSAAPSVIPGPSVTFAPQALAASTRGTVYTINSAPRAPRAAFLVYWIRWSVILMFLSGLLSVAALPFPNLIRLAAPVVCPAHYTDAFGQLQSSYDRSDNSTSYNVQMFCVDARGQKKEANGLVAWVILTAALAAAGVLAAFGVAAVMRFGLVAGCLPLLVVLGALAAGVFVYAGTIPAGGASPYWKLLVGPVSGLLTGAPIPADDGAPGGAQPTAVPGVGNGFAPLVESFGAEGSAAGQFDDTRSVAVDGAGSIYTADYSGGRIQVFDSSGKFRNQWQIKGDSIYITGLASDPSGVLYVVFGGKINKYKGDSGAFIGKLAYNASFVQLVAAAPDGGLVAASAQAIVRFDSDGKQVSAVKNWAQKIDTAGQPSADALAVDGAGNIYLVDSSADTIYKFSASGDYAGTVGAAGHAPGQLNNPRAIGFDGQGRMYVHDNQGIQVFDPSGAYLATLPVEGLGFDMKVTGDNRLVFMDRNANKVFVYQLPR